MRTMTSTLSRFLLLPAVSLLCFRALGEPSCDTKPISPEAAQTACKSLLPNNNCSGHQITIHIDQETQELSVTSSVSGELIDLRQQEYSAQIAEDNRRISRESGEPLKDKDVSKVSTGVGKVKWPSWKLNARNLLTPPWCAKTPSVAKSQPVKYSKIKIDPRHPWVCSKAFSLWLRWAIPVDKKRAIYIHQAADTEAEETLGSPASAGCIRVSESLACSLWQTVRLCREVRLAVIGDLPTDPEKTCGREALSSPEVQKTMEFRRRLYESIVRNKFSPEQVQGIFNDSVIHEASYGRFPPPETFFWEKPSALTGRAGSSDGAK